MIENLELFHLTIRFQFMEMDRKSHKLFLVIIWTITNIFWKMEEIKELKEWN